MTENDSRNKQVCRFHESTQSKSTTSFSFTVIHFIAQECSVLDVLTVSLPAITATRHYITKLPTTQISRGSSHEFCCAVCKKQANLNIYLHFIHIKLVLDLIPDPKKSFWRTVREHVVQDFGTILSKANLFEALRGFQI